jgi:hypothetical protein
MWKLVTTDEYERRQRTYLKKHPRELQAVLDNLDTYFESLKTGTKALQIKHGFLHNEGQGVVAIDQKGGGSNLAQTRLYVYPSEEEEILYLLTLGDKGSQREDIRTSHGHVGQLRKKEQDTHEEPEASQQRHGDGPGNDGG